MIKTQLERKKALSDSWYTLVAFPHSRSLSKRQQRAFVIAVGAILPALNLYAPAHPTLAQRLLASLVIVLAAVPTVLWLSGRDRGIPFLPFVAGIYGVYYALPIFLLEKYARAHYLTEVIPNSYVEQALILSLAGLGVLFIGYYTFPPRALARVVPKLYLRWEDHLSIKLVAGLLGVIGVSTYYLDAIVDPTLVMQEGVNLLADLSLISIVILFVLQLVGRLGFFATGFLWVVLVPARVLIGLSTGATSQGLVVVLLLILTYATLKHRMPWMALVAGGIALLSLLPVRAEFRALTRGAEAADRSPAEEAVLYVATARDYLTGQALPYSEALQVSISRLAHLMTFAEVVEATPSRVPFWKGETYYPVLFKPIPRFLYPDKPQENSGQAFGHRYGFLQPDDLSTSYNLPQLVEFYANFGVIGVLLGMSVVGVLYRAIQNVFIHPGLGLGAVVASVYIFTRLLLIESAFSLVFGGLFWALVLLGFVHLLMKAVERLQSRRAN